MTYAEVIFTMDRILVYVDDLMITSECEQSLNKSMKIENSTEYRIAKRL